MNQGTWKRRHCLLAAAVAAALAMPAAGVQADVARESTLQANARSTYPEYLIPGGKSLGIAIETRGLVVVGTSDLGLEASPARLAGIDSGDIITAVNGTPLQSADELEDLLKSGEQASLQVISDGESRNLNITPARDPRDGSARIGAWVRSSTAGVGTLTWVNPETGQFAALGHPISDIDTGVTLPVAEGQIYNSSIAHITPGKQGVPGEIVGDFLGEETSIGEVTLNNDYGVYGNSYSGSTDELTYPNGLPVGRREDLHTGSAQILTTLDDEIRAFDCEIEHIEPRNNHRQRAIVLHITDEELLRRTGGIVQGMSGSPIIQDGKLIGAVTHVLVNDPTRGYGIFIENMLEAAE